MRSSFLGLEVSKRSIQMAQKALDITGNNMSNAGTTGYTRQRIDTTALYMSSYSYWQTRLSKLSLAGQGVTAYGVSQIRNDYLDKRYRDMTCYAAEYDTKLAILKEIETSLDCIDNFGLYDAFLELKSKLEQVSLLEADASDMCSIVRNEASNICAMLRTYSSELSRLLENNITELQNSISNANIIIEKIVEYNKAIVGEYASTDYGRVVNGQGVSEYGPLELLDQRNLLLDELANYGDIQVTQNADGSVKVTMGGVTIIDGESHEKIVMLEYDDYNAAVLTFSNGEEFRPASGEIKAYIDMVNGHGPYAVGKYQTSEYGIPYYIDAINAFAAEFADLMNTVNGVYTDYNTFQVGLDSPPLVAGTTYSVFVSYGGVVATIEFDGGSALDDIQEQLRYYFGSKVTIDEDGIISGAIHSTELSVSIPAGATGDVASIKKLANRDVDESRMLITVNDASNGITAANIRVSDEWMNNSLMIGETFNQETGEWELPNLQGSNLSRFVQALEAKRSWGRANDLNSGSVFDYLQFLSNRTGERISFLENQYDVALDTVHTLLDNRDSISAVSDTEEGINMLVYQKWYNASSRIMTALDECLDRVINHMGRVGL